MATQHRTKGAAPAPKLRNCADFLNEWQPRVWREYDNVELDFSFKDDAITITDMRIPSMLRTGVLYTRAEVETSVDHRLGDFEKRVEAFMSQALKGRE